MSQKFWHDPFKMSSNASLASLLPCFGWRLKILYVDYHSYLMYTFFLNPTRPQCQQTLNSEKLQVCYKSRYSDIYPTKCNVTQFIYFWKLFCMFRVVPPPIIRSTHKCIYSIWHLSDRNCYLPLSWRSWSGYCLTSTRCCSYSCVCS